MKLKHIIDYVDLTEKPDFEVDYTEIEGVPNRYDRIAENKRITPKGDIDNCIQPVKSGYFIKKVVQIWEHFQINEGLSGMWNTYGDYSNNPSFHKVWRVVVEENPVYYELADFLE